MLALTSSTTLVFTIFFDVFALSSRAVAPHNDNTIDIAPGNGGNGGNKTDRHACVRGLVTRATSGKAHAQNHAKAYQSNPMGAPGSVFLEKNH